MGEAIGDLLLLLLIVAVLVALSDPFSAQMAAWLFR